ncbi:MAG TPA: AtpZ/AtpI family protein [Blastocatellia bacterium]|nr:AtpZ/AtpI family protein [Blastocatellia bacterium]HMV86732.1 AtpZ/AtpI family protein [Blastocatellia bacterium]HMX25151.1 AtpZ/AtpI family protein [Blastocatellia bacterium]HMZ21142.1 AtpZ/AtpI family protein [Blastocatellia bacterium]HNG32206.1 AtpZ/AtpI family protein [Blastocatellia bacterium]
MIRNSDPSKLALAFSVGMVLVSNIVGGIVLGYLLDRWLGTRPWLLLVGIVLGSVGGFAALYRVVSRLNQN